MMLSRQILMETEIFREFEQKVQEASVADNPEYKKYSEELKVIHQSSKP